MSRHKYFQSSTKNSRGMIKPIIGFMILIVLLIVLAVGTPLGRHLKLADLFESKKIQVFSYEVPFSEPLDLTYNITKVIVDEKGTKLINKQDQAEAILLTSINIPDDYKLVGFNESSDTNNGSNIKYQISSDYTHWYYYNGTKWAIAGNSESSTNSAEEINKFIDKLPLSSNIIKFKVFLTSTENIPVLKSIQLQISGDKESFNKKQLDLNNLSKSYACETWDKSSIEVSGSCKDNQAVFIIKNTGENMTGNSQYRIYRNNVLAETHNFKLNKNQSITISVDARCDIIRLEADQRPGHPGSSHPRATVENCGCAACNEPPVANDDTASTIKNIAVVVDVLSNDSDPDGTLNPSTVTIESGPSHGTTNINPSDGKITYTPSLGYTGTDSFVYKVCDNASGPDCHGRKCDTATVTITINPPANLPPIAVDDNASTNEDTPVLIDILANDSDPDGTLVPSTTTVISGPSHGSVTINPTNGKANYTPNTGHTGTDSFQYRVCDNDGACANATVTITVSPVAHNLPPIALDNSATTFENTPVLIDILANDSDPDGTLVPSSTTVISGPGHGSVTINPTNGKANYTPNTGHTGTDSFQYRVCDNDGACATANVIITINPIQVNLPPVANNDYGTTNQNNPVTLNILNNDYDIDGSLVPSSVQVISGTGPANGTVIINPFNGQATYTPNSNFSGVDGFNYQVCDNQGACATARVEITVLAPLPPGPSLISGIVWEDANSNSAIDTGEIRLDNIIVDLFNDSGALVKSTSTGTNGSYIFDKLPAGKYTIIIRSTTLPSGFTLTTKNQPFVLTVAADKNYPDINFGYLPPPLIVPPATLPIPPLGPIISSLGVFPQFCNRGYGTNDISMDGFFNIPARPISAIRYSLTDGLSWRNISGIPAAGGNFSFDLTDLSGGDHSVILQGVYDDGSLVSSIPCKFSISTGLIFGANEFTLSDRASPMLTSGIVQFVVGEPQDFYLEAEGATSAVVIDNQNNQTFYLSYDPNLKLWKGKLLFDKPGLYQLEGVIKDSVGNSYNREINYVFVSDKSKIIDIEKNQPVNNAKITIYQKDEDTGNFQIWNQDSFNQMNPFQVSNKGNFSVILPSGEYYFKIEAPGYDTITSLITKIDQYSTISADIKLVPKRNIWNKFVSLFSTSDVSNNFTVNPIPLVSKNLLEINNPVPDITLRGNDGTSYKLYDRLIDKPAVLFVYSSWNTLVQEELEIYTHIAEKLSDKYNFIPLSTMEPMNVNAHQVNRGEYPINFFKTDSKFYDLYFTISLPQFYVIDKNGNLLETIVGSYSEESLYNSLKSIKTVPAQ